MTFRPVEKRKVKALENTVSISTIKELINPGASREKYKVKTYIADGVIVLEGFVALNSSGTALSMTLADPGYAGRHLIITQIDGGTDGHTVTAATSGAFDGTNEIATFNAQYETLILVSVASTRWVIVENVGSVGLST